MTTRMENIAGLENTIFTHWPPPMVSEAGERLIKKTRQGYTNWKDTRIASTSGARDSDPFRRTADQILRGMHHDQMHETLDAFLDLEELFNPGGAERPDDLPDHSYNNLKRRNRAIEGRADTQSKPRSRGYLQDSEPRAIVSKHRSYATFDGWLPGARQVL